MGTSTMGSDLHSDKQDKLLKLQARKKELEQMLAAKNEELYTLCVQEVRLTGVVPPEAPLSPDAPRERLPSVRSGDSHDGAARRLCHRLSTPSVSGASVRGAPAQPHPRPTRRPDTGCAFFPSPPHERPADTFSIHTSHTYPALAARLELAPSDQPRRPRGLRETHFSSSHPDIAAPHPPGAAPPRPAPLLYQYASQLRAQSQHLAHAHAPPHGRRRSALQRTQTYHLTSHSDYSQHLDAMCHMPRPPDVHEQAPERRAPVPATLPLRLGARHAPYAPLQVATDDGSAVRSPSEQFSPPSDGRGKDKQWYETSLDSPPRETSLRKSASLKRSPGSGPVHYEALHSPPVLSPGAVSLESPTNMTVIEQGRCIPYREETKPFEMSDFYKYSTKFRQAQAPRPAAQPHPAYSKLPAELPRYSPDQWHTYGNGP